MTISSENMVATLHRFPNLSRVPALGLQLHVRHHNKRTGVPSRAFDPSGMMVGQLSGETAGQTVFHLHFHVIPRYEASGFRFHGQPVADQAELAANAAAIRACLE